MPPADSKPLTPTDPTSIAQFKIRRRLGSGGMGLAYYAQDPTGRPVVIKLIHPHFSADPQFRRRFRREVEAMSALRGPYTANLLAADTSSDRQWVAMEYVAGTTLLDRVFDGGPLPPAQVEVLAVGLAFALEAIHAVGVVHRDLKPGNIMLTDRGPRLLDFGIATVSDGTQLTSTGQHWGATGWMAPEYLRNDQTLPAGDIHGWALLVYFAATGSNPYGTGSGPTLALRIVTGEHDLSRLPDRLSAWRPLLERCLQLEPSRRPRAEEVLSVAQAHRLSEDLDAAVEALAEARAELDHLDGAAGPPSGDEVRRPTGNRDGAAKRRLEPRPLDAAVEALAATRADLNRIKAAATPPSADEVRRLSEDRDVAERRLLQLQLAEARRRHHAAAKALAESRTKLGRLKAAATPSSADEVRRLTEARDVAAKALVKSRSELDRLRERI